MKTAFNFERLSLERGQVPLATSRLAKLMTGENKEALCR